MGDFLGRFRDMGVKSPNPVNNSEEEGYLPAEVNKILHSLASDWNDVVDSKGLQVTPLKGALTNQVFQIHWPTLKPKLPRKVLVRIYGEGVDVFFNRDDEIQTFECMSKHRQGPRLLGRFSNGRVEEFIHARTLSASDLRDPEVSALIASKLREFHYLDMPGPRNVILWDRLRNWLTVAKRLSSPEEAKAFLLDSIEGEINTYEKELSGENQEVGFCQNDLQYGNIMLDEENRLVTLIDYKYASYNPVAFDLANHFCEMAADYHSDYGKYPGNEPSDIEVEQLVQDVEKYAPVSHLFWGLWGLISYARQRFEQYWLKLFRNEPEGTGKSVAVVYYKKRIWIISLASIDLGAVINYQQLFTRVSDLLYRGFWQPTDIRLFYSPMNVVMKDDAVVFAEKLKDTFHPLERIYKKMELVSDHI